MRKKVTSVGKKSNHGFKSYNYEKKNSNLWDKKSKLWETGEIAIKYCTNEMDIYGNSKI